METHFFQEQTVEKSLRKNLCGNPAPMKKNSGKPASVCCCWPRLLVSRKSRNAVSCFPSSASWLASRLPTMAATSASSLLLASRGTESKELQDVYPGSRIFPSRIPDPGSWVKKIPDPGSGSTSKNLSMFKTQKLFLSSRKMIRDDHHGSGSRFRFFTHPDPEVKMAPDPRSGSAGSATLAPSTVWYIKSNTGKVSRRTRTCHGSLP